MYCKNIHADACHTLSRVLADLHRAARPLAGSLLGFERSQAAVEADMLDLARKATFDGSLPASFLHCRSKAFLSALPDREEKRLLSHSDTEQVLPWISADHMALAIQKGYHPARSAQRMIDHLPGDPEWEAMVLGPYSQAGIAMESLNGQRNFVLAREIGEVMNTQRLARFLQAQVRHHPENMSGALRAAFRGQSASVIVPVVLIAAGVPVDFDLKPDPALEEVYATARSNHGRMKIIERHGGLESVLSVIRANTKARQKWAGAAYQM